MTERGSGRPAGRGLLGWSRWSGAPAASGEPQGRISPVISRDLGARLLWVPPCHPRGRKGLAGVVSEGVRGPGSFERKEV